jgi:hypothetical protein
VYVQAEEVAHPANRSVPVFGQRTEHFILSKPLVEPDGLRFMRWRRQNNLREGIHKLIFRDSAKQWIEPLFRIRDSTWAGVATVSRCSIVIFPLPTLE